MDVGRERIKSLWSTVFKKALAKHFSFNVGEAHYLCVCRRLKLPGRGVHSEKVRETGKSAWAARQKRIDSNYYWVGLIGNFFM